MKSRNPEYYQAHGQRLEFIAERVGSLIEGFPGDRIVATKQPGDETVTLIAGALDPAKAPSHINTSWARKFAASYNNAQTEIANLKLAGLLAYVSIWKAEEREEANREESLTAGDSSRPLVIHPVLPYTNARFTGAKWNGKDESVTLAATTMDGPDGQSTWQASRHEVTYEDGLTGSIFSVTALDGAVLMAKHRLIAMPSLENSAPLSSLANQFDQEMRLNHALDLPTPDDMQKVEQLLATL